jgi:hypothetical protein
MAPEPPICSCVPTQHDAVTIAIRRRVSSAASRRLCLRARASPAAYPLRQLICDRSYQSSCGFQSGWLGAPLDHRGRALLEHRLGFAPGGLVDAPGSGSSPAMSAAGSAPRAGNIPSIGWCSSRRRNCAAQSNGPASAARRSRPTSTPATMSGSSVSPGVEARSAKADRALT